MPKYVLHYFNVRGRAEPTRLCFAAAGIEYEDIRHTRDEWQAMKKEDGSTPLGQLPMMVVDGEKFSQSMAIFRYTARETGLCPSESLQIAKCDMIVDTENDLAAKRIKYYYEKDEKLKQSLKDEYEKTHLPDFFSKMESLLKMNKEGKGYFVGEKLTFADIIVFNICSNHLSIVSGFPVLQGHHDRIRDIPGIKSWLQKRPQTEL